MSVYAVLFGVMCIIKRVDQRKNKRKELIMGGLLFAATGVAVALAVFSWTWIFVLREDIMACQIFGTLDASLCLLSIVLIADMISNLLARILCSFLILWWVACVVFIAGLQERFWKIPFD